MLYRLHQHKPKLANKLLTLSAVIFYVILITICKLVYKKNPTIIRRIFFMLFYFFLLVVANLEYVVEQLL